MRQLNKENLRKFIKRLLVVILLIMGGYGLTYTPVAFFTGCDWGHGIAASLFHSLILVGTLMVLWFLVSSLKELINWIYPKKGEDGKK